MRGLVGADFFDKPKFATHLSMKQKDARDWSTCERNEAEATWRILSPRPGRSCRPTW